MRPYFSSSNTGISPYNNVIYPVDGSGGATTATTDIGHSSYKFKNLYLSNNLSLSNASTSAFLQVSTDILQFGTSSDDPIVFYANNTETLRIRSDKSASLNDGHLIMSNGYGVHFGASAGSGASSTVLDDYEEGVWTVRLTDASANDCGYQSRTGHYTKIGNLVYVIFAIEINSKSGVGNALQIRGLPFTVENVSAGGGEPSGGSLTFANNLISRDLGGGIILRANNATDYIEMKYTAGGAQTGIGATNFNATDIGADTYMTGFCMYRT